MQKLKKNCPRVAAIMLSLMMMVVFVPTFAFAADSGTITVYLTVSDQGQLAKANDGSPMAWKEVTVIDSDGDGHYSFHEALIAAHREYNSESGYDNPSGSWVNALWGKTTPTFFYKNGTKTSTVDTEEISKGDFLLAGLYADVDMYSDYYTCFEKPFMNAIVGNVFTVNLSGHVINGDAKSVAVSGADVLVCDKDGNKKVGTTDKNGKVTLSFDKAGTYVLTADAVVKGAEVDAGETWYLSEATKDAAGKTIYGHITDWNTYETFIGFTATNHGDGPYPASELQWIDQEDFDAATWTEEKGYLLYSSFLSVDSKTTAPACIVTVTPKTSIVKATVTAKNGTYTGKALKPAVTVKLDGKTLKSGTDYTVAYSNNTKAGTAKITVTGKESYTGTATGKFTIAKAAQPLTVKAKTAKLKVKKLKKKNQNLAVSKVLTVKSAKGKVTYKKVKGNKKITINKTTGKVTVKKKLTKGTYKVRVKVNAAGNSNYKSGAKTVTFKIKVTK